MRSPISWLFRITVVWVIIILFPFQIIAVQVHLPSGSVIAQMWQVNLQAGDSEVMVGIHDLGVYRRHNR